MEKELKSINDQLSDLLTQLKKANVDGQMDYVTHPRLSDEVDRLVVTSDRISKIVYQQK